MEQLVEKCRKEEAVAKAQAVCDAAMLDEEKQKTAKEEREGQKAASPKPETDTKQGGMDSQTRST